MQMDSGLDTGPILAMEKRDLVPSMTVGQLHDELSLLGAELLIKTVAELKAGIIAPASQPKEGVLYATKLTREDEKICFANKADFVQRHILALNPWPGAVAVLEGKPIKILSCRVAHGVGKVGSVIAIHPEGPEVACGEGSVIVTEVQVPGKRRMTAAEWMRGHALKMGMQWQ
ncbi:methionyl-tRNA formyltransferase [Candidatus Magnetaquicoccus inordinatus]|uniref:methionyl-tRNA formyltransferase n=1 Tax=Candidatus Magnetaquicoccus inordinatus TaxID=2496818 RepID=UPI00102AB0D2|nr:hypothetical protein [Candidatus Magnetaquicoccus inordinatus]